MNVAAAARPIKIPELAIPSGGISSGTAGGRFASALGSAISEVESAKGDAKAAAMDLLTGNKGDVHDVALASQRAELTMELFQQVRNKFVQAYQEIMKMPM